MEISLTGKRALVTGANSGLGRAIALELSRCGADVAVNYVVHPESADAVRREIEANGRKSLALEADVSDAAAVASMFGRFCREWGDPDVLVCNAGVDGDRALGWEADPEAWMRTVRINLFGAFHCAREALRRMIPRRSGVVLNITSVHERIPWEGYSAYTASKAGLSMLTRTLAQEAAPHGVRVLALAPGAVRTPINENVWGNPDSLRDLLQKIPLGRIGEPEEVARTAAVLLSEAGSYVTGTTVFVDGGMTLYPSFQHGG
jgi:glucose 1-dehydrogenase